VKGIVLDFDGVIARSMEQHAEAYRRVLGPFQVPVGDEDVFIREGARSETIIRDFLERAGKRVSDDRLKDLADEKQRVFESLGTPELYEGAKEMVRALRRPAWHLGLVTGTRRENLEAMIPDMLPWFDAVLSQDAYTKDKPDPEPYLKAAEAIGVDPSECAALENAARGVESAKKAGYDLVVAITTTLKERVLRTAGADVVVKTHDEAARTLTDWLTPLP